MTRRGFDLSGDLNLSHDPLASFVDRRMWHFHGMTSEEFEQSDTSVCPRNSENIPAPVETLPASWIKARCALCEEWRAYLPGGIFQGRLSWKLLRKRVRTADGRIPR
jgi:hypothetical protein